MSVELPLDSEEADIENKKGNNQGLVLNVFGRGSAFSIPSLRVSFQRFYSLASHCVDRTLYGVDRIKHSSVVHTLQLLLQVLIISVTGTRLEARWLLMIHDGLGPTVWMLTLLPAHTSPSSTSPSKR